LSTTPAVVLSDDVGMETSPQTHIARIRHSARSLGPFDYAATLAVLGVYFIGSSMDEGPNTSLDYYRAAATVIPTLLMTVAIHGRVFELSRKVTFRLQYRTVLFAVVVFAGEAGTLMTIAREKTNWAAHLYVYAALLALGVAFIYLALTGIDEPESGRKEETGGAETPQRRGDPPACLQNPFLRGFPRRATGVGLSERSDPQPSAL
jgi:hypothetical protein